VDRFGRKASNHKTRDLHIEMTMRSIEFPQRDHILKLLGQHPGISAKEKAEVGGSSDRPTQNVVSITGITMMTEKEYASYNS
jgi:hypothetical protein